MALKIRKALAEDINVLCDLMKEISWHEISQEEMQNRLDFVDNSPVDDLFVCEENNRVFGVMGFRIRENLEEVSKFGEVSIIVVNPGDHHKGIGTCLMNFAEQLALKKGCVGTWLVSGFGREEQAHHFYLELGYESTGYRFVKRF